MKVRGIFAVLLLLTGLQSALAQKFTVYMANKQVVKFSVTEVDSIVFSELDDWVDLGLPSGTLWATCNLGASSPEEYGDYFSWGETEPKESYSWSNYKWCNGTGDVMTKYCLSSEYGQVDNKESIELSDDAARASWGGDWRIPTETELEELRVKCTWEWTTQNGYNGYKVTSKKNGQSIFLPAAGWRYDAYESRVGSDGYYWSSTPDEISADNACDLYFSEGYHFVDWDYRFDGRSVRPVLE